MYHLAVVRVAVAKAKQSCSAVDFQHMFLRMAPRDEASLVFPHRLGECAGHRSSDCGGEEFAGDVLQTQRPRVSGNSGDSGALARKEFLRQAHKSAVVVRARWRATRGDVDHQLEEHSYGPASRCEPARIRRAVGARCSVFASGALVADVLLCRESGQRRKLVPEDVVYRLCEALVGVARCEDLGPV